MSGRGNGPRVESVDDLWCWANIWGDLLSHPRFTHAESLAYEAAIRDLMVRLEEMGVTLGQAREAWPKWSGVPT